MWNALPDIVMNTNSPKTASLRRKVIRLEGCIYLNV